MHYKIIESAQKDENLFLPENLNFETLSFLSPEEKEKLKKIQPETLGQAWRVEGMTPASLVLLHAMCRAAKKDKNRVTMEQISEKI